MSFYCQDNTNEKDVVDADDYHEPSDDMKDVVNECNNESKERFNRE